MQLEAVDAIDAIILAPAIGGAVRAAAEQAVQHGQERRALQREVMLARPRQAFDHAPAARLLPHPLECERRTDAPGRDRRPLAAVERVEHDCLVGEARPRAQEPLQLPALLQVLDPSERRDHLLAHRRALAPALDDLQIGAAARDSRDRVSIKNMVAALRPQARNDQQCHARMVYSYQPGHKGSYL